MGIYVNPDEEVFRSHVEGPIYVDKSPLVAELNKLYNTEWRSLCVSRPRRFGKTMAGNMISAYYSKGANSRALFENLKLAQLPDWDVRLNKVNVIKFDMQSFFDSYVEDGTVMQKLHATIGEELSEAFPQVDISKCTLISEMLVRINRATKEEFVVIIDEYDILVRDTVPEDLFRSYLRFLNVMFKSDNMSQVIKLAYITGILPMIRDRVESKLNSFTEYTIQSSDNLAPYMGFTKEETQALCEAHGMDFAECARWYDGYNVDGIEIFNPRSVVSSMRRKRYGSYWTATGSFESIATYVHMDFDGLRQMILKMIGGEGVVTKLSSFANCKESIANASNVIAYLLHLGYLTYDQDTQECRIPNKEIREEWINALEVCPNYKKIVDIVNASRDLLRATQQGDAEAVAAALDAAHQETTTALTYNNEATFQAVMTIAYFYANSQYTIFKELPAGRGYSDMALIPYVKGVPAIILELKVNTAPEVGLEQIREKRYADALRNYSGELLLVCVSYDRDTKEHSCVIERHEV